LFLRLVFSFFCATVDLPPSLERLPSTDFFFGKVFWTCCFRQEVFLRLGRFFPPPPFPPSHLRVFVFFFCHLPLYQLYFYVAATLVSSRNKLPRRLVSPPGRFWQLGPSTTLFLFPEIRHSITEGPFSSFCPPRSA